MAAKTLTPLARDFVATEAMALGDLMLWINQARDLIEEIRCINSFTDSPLHHAIKEYGVSIGTPDWTGLQAGEGLAYLLHHQHELIHSLA